MIAASIGTGLTAFQVALQAAKPLSAAPPLQVSALIQQGSALLNLVDAQIAATDGSLDAAPLDGPIETLPARVTAVATTGQDQTTLHDLRGLLGRAVFNLTQGQA